MMHQNDILKFSTALGTVALVFGHTPQSGLYDAYFFALADQMTIEQFERACKLAMTKCKWFPKPAELLELVDDTDFFAGEAWKLAVKFVRDQPRAITFSDSLINATIRRLGGRGVFASLGEQELERFWKTRFFNEYRLLKSIANIPASMLEPLPPMLRPGHFVPDPRPINIECSYGESIKKIEQKRDAEIDSAIIDLATKKSTTPKIKNEHKLNR